LSARNVARARLGDGRFRPPPARLADAALRFVLRLALAGGRDSFTPDRRAFDRPIAIACFVDFAPCFPSRMWCISSRTNSPACVLAAFPCCLSRCARLNVSCSGIVNPSRNGVHSAFHNRRRGRQRINTNVTRLARIDICVFPSLLL
jgi:hypothetical protein